MKNLCLVLAAAGLSLAGAPAPAASQPLSPSAQAMPSPVSPASATPPSAPLAGAAPLSPSAAAPTVPALAPPTGLTDGLSATAAALAAPPASDAAAENGDPAPPEEVADPLALTAQPLDLGALASPLLLKLARALSKGSDKVWYDPELQQALTASSPGAQSAAADALYAELNRRAALGDKEAKQALDLAVKLHGDLRALPVSASPSAQALSPAAQVVAAALSPVAQPGSPAAPAVSPAAQVSAPAAPALSATAAP